MKARFSKSLLTGSAEIILSIVWVMLFFLVFLGLLSVSFPQGESLRSLMQNREFSSPTNRPAGEEVLIATLSEIHKKVKHKPASNLTWNETHAGMPLGNRHSIQTLNEAEATIAFDEGNEVQMGENSLVVLKRAERDPAGAERPTAVVVLEGELRGKLKGRAGGAAPVEVVTADSMRFRSGGSPEEGTTFAVNVDKDGTSTFSVYEGRAEVSLGADTVLVGKNQTVTIAKSTGAAVVEDLPAPPTLTAPEERALVVYRASPPPVKFAWISGGDADAYDFVLARDPKLTDVVHQSRITDTSTLRGDLRAGQYYWQVTGLKGRVKGVPSRTSSLRLVADAEPPRLEVGFPDEVVEGPRLTLRGFVEPGADLFVSNTKVAVTASGSFEHVVELQRGLNMIVVEAIDPVGNTAYRSRLVRARF